MKITVNQIENVIEDNYLEYLRNNKAKNLMFIGNYCIGKNSVIKKWASKHNDLTLRKDCYPQQLHKTNEFGILEKQNIYTYADQTLDYISKNKTVLYCQRINFGRENTGDRELIRLIKDDKYKTLFEKEYDLSNRMFTIATAYPNYENNHNITLSNELLSLFEIYEVEADYDETLTHFKETYEKYKNKIMNKPLLDKEDKEDLLETENALLIIKDLLEDKSLIKITKECNPRRIEMCLQMSKNKEEFTKNLNEQANFDSK